MKSKNTEETVEIPIEVLKEIVLYCNAKYTLDGYKVRKRWGISHICSIALDSESELDGIEVPKDDLMNLYSVIDYDQTSCSYGRMKDSLAPIEEIAEENSRFW